MALILAAITWLPLILLGYGGVVLLGGSKSPLLYDFGPHIRFLVALTVLILSEVWIATRMGAGSIRLLPGAIFSTAWWRGFP